MARKLRVEYAGAIYHVMNRGDRRERIFMDDADRRRFVETLGEVCAKTGWQVHAYVLMPNQTPSLPPPKTALQPFPVTQPKTNLLAIIARTGVTSTFAVQ